MLDWRTVQAAEPVLGPASFRLWRCSACGSAVTEEGLQSGLHEAGAYRPGEPRMYRLAVPLLKLFDAQRLALVRSLVSPPARLLDAGAGRGRFVSSARAAGFDGFGIEPARRGSSVAGEAVIAASIEEANIEPSSLDVVTLWHVLEHLSNPATALELIATWLRPGGVLLVGVPNLKSLQALLTGARWYHLDVPRHRVHFTPGGLQRLLVQTGFTPISAHHLLLEQNQFGMWQSLINCFTRTPSYLYNALKRNAPLRSRDLPITVAGLALLPVAAVLELAAGLARRGGTIAVLARRA